MKKQIFNKKNLIILILIVLTLSGILIFNKIGTMHLESQSGEGELARAMTYGELTDDDEKTQSDFVKFSAFFLRDLDSDGYAERVKGTCKEIGQSDTLYMSLSVLAEGTFKNGKITFENNNMYFQTALVDDETISGNYISNNTTSIDLKDVIVGTQKLIFGNVRSGIYNSNSYNKTLAIGTDTTKYSAINRVTITGTHVSDDGTETEISKTIELPVDWYSTPTTEIPYTYAGEEKNIYQNYDNAEIVNEENQTVNLEFKVVTQEVDNSLNLSKAYLEGIIPEFNGFAPVSVVISGTNVNYTYDIETRKFTAERNAELNANGRVITQAYSGSYDGKRYNEFKFEVQYPLEAYTTLGIDTINLNIPVKAYYEGYNNPNEEFDNPVRSNLAEEIISIIYEFGGGDTIGFDMRVGEYVAHPYNAWVVSKENPARIYQNREAGTEYEYVNDIYDVTWYISRGADSTISNVKVKENDEKYTDEFVDADGVYTSMDPYITNKGIYLVGAGGMFGENGYVDVINDETDELIHRFTSEDWSLYTKESPYMYETPVKHIRIETSATNKNSSFQVHNLKEIDNEILTNTLTAEEFENIKLIFSYLTGYIKYTETDEYKAVKNDQERANYDVKQSIVNIVSITPDFYSTQETKENAKIVINTQTLNYNTVGWKNGQFLLKFPSDIMTLEINSVEISNSNVTILGYGLEKLDDGYYLKILTENENDETYAITIDCDITPDPRNLTATKDLELYSMNETAEFYRSESKDIYDIDSDGDLEEYIGKNTKAIQLIGPTSLITMETASEYNENGDELETSISPQVAIIDKLQENKNAKISASLLNNYSGKISGIKLVGKIPFEGNTFQLTEKDLGSTYTAVMTEPITVPEDLQEYASVYYSENEIVTGDMADTSNNWETEDEVEDFSKIRTYMIDLNDYVMEQGEERVCTYQIQIPEDIQYNDVAYSTHAVYFYLETEEGKYKDETETNKLGFMIARKYDIEINKTKLGKDTKIKNAVFEIIEEETGNRRVVATNAEGTFTAKDLYVDRTYIIKEIKAPNDYILDSQEIKITATVDENGEFSVTKLSGTTKDELTIRDGDTKKIVTVNIENKPKYTMVLDKFVEGTTDKVQGAKFRVTGKGLPTSGRLSSTNAQGQITIAGLYPDEVYTIVEEYAKGYEYSEEAIEFKTVWDGTDLKAEVVSGSFREEPTVDNEQEKQPILHVSIDNKKLKEYSFEITKYEKDSEKVLNGAIFEITGKWLDEEIKTDENGKATVPVLYENIEYTLTETYAPQGYVLDEKTVRFVGTFDENNRLIVTILEGELIDEKVEGSSDTTYGEVQNSSATIIEAKEAKVSETTEGNKMFSLGIENEPLFKLIKTDGTTAEVMPNVKFAIKKINDDKTEVDAVDTKGNLIGEEYTVNGVTYRVIETDENGEIGVDLPEGAYKAIEVETLEGYVLEDDIEKRSYEFAIGRNVPAVKELEEQRRIELDSKGSISFHREIATSDGGYLIAGTLEGRVIFDAEKTVANQEIEIVENASAGGDGILIKYDSNNKIEWAKRTYGTIYETPTDVEEIDDGYLVAYQGKTLSIPANETVQGTNINIGVIDYDFIVVKYTFEGLVEWAVSSMANVADYVNGIEATSDGGFIVTGTCRALDMTIPASKTTNGEEIILSNRAGVTTTNGLIIKYNSEQLIEWANLVSGNGGNNLNQIHKIINENGEEEYLVTCELSNAIFNEEDLVEGLDIGYESGVWKGTIKYNLDGKICKSFYETESFSSNPLVYINEDNSRIVMQKNIIYEYDQNDILTRIITLGNLPFNFNCIDKTKTGYVVSGLYSNSYTIPASLTEKNEDIPLIYNIQNDVVVIKFNDEFLISDAFIYGSEGNESNAQVKELQNGEINIIANFAGETSIGDSVIIGPTSIRLDENNNVILTDSIITETSNILKATRTSDDGIIAVGNYSGEIILDVNGEEKKYYSNGGTDAIVIKYNKDDVVEWAYSIGSGGDDSFKSVIEAEGKYIVVGEYRYGVNVNAEDTVSGEAISFGQKNSNANKGILLEFDSDGKVESYLNISNTAIHSFYDIEKTEDNGYILNVAYSNNLTVSNIEEETTEIKVSYNGYYDAALLKLDRNYKLINHITFGSGVAKSEIFDFMQMCNDGGIIVSGKLGTTMTVTTRDGEDIELVYSWEDPFIIKYSSDLELEWASAPGGGYGGSKHSMATSDNGAILVGTMYYNGINIPAEKTVNGEAISFNKYGQAWCGFIIKYNETGLAEWGYRFPNSSGNLGNIRAIEGTDEIILIINSSVKFEAENTYSGKVISNTVQTGYKTIARIKLNGKVESVNQIYDIPINGEVVEDGKYLFYGSKSVDNRNRGLIVEYDENLIAAEIPAQQVVEVKNYKKQFEITTEVKVHEDGTKGGSISGEGDTPYETVIYDENSINEIKITPDSGYEILKIIVNDVEMSFTTEEDGTVILPVFENVKENKHIVVEFSDTVSEVVVHHYKDGTTESVADSETIRGIIGENYTTAPKVDLEDYEVIVEKIPSNASGTYTDEVQEIIYYYQERPVVLTVHHYLEGTLEELSATIVEEFKKGDSYTTSVAADIDEKYELVFEPANASGTITKDTEVNYYYKVKVYEITTEVNGEGGDISGSGAKPYEEVEHGQDSQKEIIAVPNKGYKVSKITINDEEISFVENADRTVSVDKFTEVKEDKHIVVTFERISGLVNVNHYIEGTTEKIPLPDGSVIETEIKEGYVGEIFATQPTDKLPEYYELVSSTEETSGAYEEEEQEVIYYYALKEYEYSIEYYYDDIKDDSKTETGVATYGSSIDEYTDKVIDGYEFEKAGNKPLTITTTTEDNIMKIYYIKRTDLSYTVKYLEQGTEAELAENKVVENQTFEAVVTEQAIDIEGYDKVAPTEQSITIATSGNEIIFYYTKRTDLSYRVEYYFNDVIDDSLTDTFTATYLDEIDSYTDKVKPGYKYDSDTAPITIGVGENVIKVYYITDETQTKELKYTVEYYKNGILEETDEFTIIVQLLEPDILEVNKAEINTSDKYDGYKFVETDLEIIPDEIANNGVIKVYYEKDNFEYTIEYYYDGIKDDSKTVIRTAIFESQIDTYEDKVIDGYEFEKVEGKPITITSNPDNNVMKVYYIRRTDLSYTVKYLEQGTDLELAEEKIVTGQKFNETVTEQAIDIEGYDKVAPTEQSITIATSGNEIIFYYTKRTDLNYRVEYYFNDVIDDSLTDTIAATYLDEIDSYTDKVKPGYKYDSDTAPITIGVGENVIKVYYITDETQIKELKYTVEYYKNGILEETDEFTIVVQLLEPDILEVNKDEINVADKYDGYKFVGTEPETIPDEIAHNGVIKVYYEKDNFEYTIEYYYDDVKDDSKTVTGTAIFESQIDTYEDKNITGYKFEKVEGKPITITSNPNNNVMKIYYVKDTFEYSVEYYYNGQIDNQKTDVFTATYLDEITTYQEKLEAGYKFNRTNNLPLIVSEKSENNIIKVYYISDDAQTKELKYTVEYYKDGIFVENEEFTTVVQLLEPDILEVNKAEINTTDKYDGYKFVNTDPETIPYEIAHNGVIKVYYEKDNFEYTIEYYYDGIKDDSKTVTGTALFESQIDTYTDKVIDGYEFEKVEGNPITITSNPDNNVMKVYYIRRTDLSYTVKYLEQGTNVELAEEKTVTGQKFNETATEQAIDIEGYDKVDPTEQSITIATSGNEIIFYYTKRTDLSYRIEYYFNDVIDDSLTDTFEATYLEEITTYEDKVKLGYKYDSDTAPITIGVGENVIKVYYITDETQTKELKYTVEYYKDGNFVENEEFTTVVQLLEPDILEVNKNEINITDKYDGYKFINTNPEIIPDEIAHNGVIKVYYEKDNFEYTIEYYYDGIKDDSKTVTGTAIFESQIDTYEDKVIDGYEFEKVEGNPIIITSNPDSNVMKVYYIRRTDLSYTVKYLEQGTNVELAEEKIVIAQKFNETVTEQAIDIEGYDKVAPTEQSITIATSGNEIIFYYTKRIDLNYRVEYYFNDVIDDSLTDTFEATYLEKITTYEDKVKPGYKYDSDTAPITIGVEENVIKVYYITDETQTKELKYTVEYYKNGILEETEEFTTVIQLLEPDILEVNKDAINTTDKYEGYRFVNTDPETIPDEIAHNGVIKVYYVIDDENTKELSYTVEYYKDGILEETEEFTEVVQILEPDVLEVNKDEINTTDKYMGYRYENTEPEVIPDEITNGGVIKVYYVKDQFEYRVEYYYAGVKDDSKTDVFTANYKDRIENVVEKVSSGYKFEKAENIPLVISEVAEDNVIKVYYITDETQTKELKYTVEYYKDGILEETEEFTEVVQILEPDILEVNKDEINVADKYDGYKFVETNPETIPDEIAHNGVIKVYYERKDAEVIVKYYEQNSENALAEDVVITGKVFDEYSTEAKEIEGYTLVGNTENTEGEMTEEPIVVIYYYAKEVEVVVKHIDKNTGEVLDEETIQAKDGDIVETMPKDIPEYVLIETPEETTVVVEKEDIEVIYVYVKVSAGVVEKHIDVKSGEILETNVYEGNEGDPYSTSESEFEGYDLVMDMYPENAKGTMTKELIEVKYYYIRKATLKVEYVDYITGEIVEGDSTVIVEGHEGDEYSSEEKEFDGYVLIEEPENDEGILNIETSVDENGNISLDTQTEVVYKYAREAEVVVEHIDITTGEKLLDDEYIEGYEGKEYTTESKEITKYVLVEEPANKEGVMKVEEVVDEETGETTLNNTITVTYKYDKNATKVIVRHINKHTGEIFEEEEIVGKVDAEYKTEPKEFENYKLIEEEYPENAEGTFTEEIIIVNYYYKRLTRVIVQYIDVITGEFVSEEIEVNGDEGDTYSTIPKEIPGYVLVEEKYPDNAEGTMDEEEEKVYYYYVREAKVEVTYIDKETGEEIANKVIIEGKEGDTYNTEEKEIEYYELVKVENPDGEMKVTVTKDEETGEEIIDNVTEVIYEYRKAEFDMAIEKTVEEILVNGENRNIGNNKLVKAEIHRKKIANSEVRVIFQIKVTNTGELNGSAVISDRLPDGLTFYSSENPGWTEKGNLLYRETEILKPGESAIYEVVLHWDGSKEIGTFTNQAEIVSTENEAEYEEIDVKDNESEATVIIVTATGVEIIMNNIEMTKVIDIAIFTLYAILIYKFIIKRKRD